MPRWCQNLSLPANCRKSWPRWARRLSWRVQPDEAVAPYICPTPPLPEPGQYPNNPLCCVSIPELGQLRLSDSILAHHITKRPDDLP